MFLGLCTEELALLARVPVLVLTEVEVEVEVVVVVVVVVAVVEVFLLMTVMAKSFSQASSRQRHGISPTAVSFLTTAYSHHKSMATLF